MVWKEKLDRLSCVARRVRHGVRGHPTNFVVQQLEAESNKQDLARKATFLVSQIHVEAARAQDAAGRLEANALEPEVGWQVDGNVLGQVKHWANAMDKNLCQLETIQRSLPAAQRNEVNKIAPDVVGVTDSTQSAIWFLGQHQNNLFLRQFEPYAKSIYQASGRVEVATAGPLSHATQS